MNHLNLNDMIATELIFLNLFLFQFQADSRPITFDPNNEIDNLVSILYFLKFMSCSLFIAVNLRPIQVKFLRSFCNEIIPVFTQGLGY